MLRFLALLIVCVASFLMQGEPAAAHEKRSSLLQAVVSAPMGNAAVSVSPNETGDCPSGQACCVAACTPCQAPLFGDRTEPVTPPVDVSSVPISPEEFPQSNLPDRDPPVPKA
jgi:hypothetical protein